MNIPETPGRQGSLLSRADELTLARRIEQGDLKAKATMIERNLRLVHAVARNFRGSGVPFADSGDAFCFFRHYCWRPSQCRSDGRGAHAGLL